MLLATIEHRQNIRALCAQYPGNQRSLALLFAALLIFLALRVKRLQQRIDSHAPLRPTV